VQNPLQKTFQDGHNQLKKKGKEKAVYATHPLYYHRHLLRMAVHDVVDQIFHEALLLE
jgi:hypothetical protein